MAQTQPYDFPPHDGFLPLLGRKSLAVTRQRRQLGGGTVGVAAWRRQAAAPARWRRWQRGCGVSGGSATADSGGSSGSLAAARWRNRSGSGGSMAAWRQRQRGGGSLAAVRWRRQLGGGSASVAAAAAAARLWWRWRRGNSMTAVAAAAWQRWLQQCGGGDGSKSAVSSRLGKKSIASSDMSCRWQR